jgi:alcohol dehydrogenase class IV
MPESLSSFDFFAPAQIVFGWGRVGEIGPVARSLGRRAFLVSGSTTLERNGVLQAIEASLEQAGLSATRLATISREPQVADVDETARRLCGHGLTGEEVVIALGGGSAIDLAKAVAAMATNGRQASVRDFLEGVGAGRTMSEPPLPVVAIPTTAGTGSEATKNAVISSVDPPFKKSLRSALMVPRAVVIDPELTVSLPASVTAFTGMDAITQLIESYLSRRARPIPRALALEGLSAALPAIARAVENPGDRDARARMAYAALLSGLALANSGLGLAHGVAAALGMHGSVPHGLACAVMLPAALRANRDVRRADLARLGTLLGTVPSDSDEVAAGRFIDSIDALARRIGIPARLSAIGVQRSDLPALVRASRGSSMDGNPRQLDDEELGGLLEAML